MKWFSIRTIYLFGKKSSNINIYEERIVVFKAKNIKEAHIKALKESKQYAEDNDFEMHNEQLSYEQDGKNLIDGYEVWSELFESTKSLNEFYDERYKKFLYHTDE